MTNNTQLPDEWVIKIDQEAQERYPYSIQATERAAYKSIAKEYATKLHETQAQATLIANKGYEWERKLYKEQEESEAARALLHEVLVMNEMWGDLPGEYIDKVKIFLDGTQH